MIRQPEREQLNRLSSKTLNQVFVMRAKEGLSCSQFEAEALRRPGRVSLPDVVNWSRQSLRICENSDACAKALADPY